MDGRQRVSAFTPPATHATSRTECDLTYDFISVQKFREDEENLFFNAKSPWRWCEFTAHPRVMLYADGTGAELTDIRVREELLGALGVKQFNLNQFNFDSFTLYVR